MRFERPMLFKPRLAGHQPLATDQLIRKRRADVRSSRHIGVLGARTEIAVDDHWRGRREGGIDQVEQRPDVFAGAVMDDLQHVGRIDRLVKTEQLCVDGLILRRA